jgi:hypothetical protein
MVFLMDILRSLGRGAGVASVLIVASLAAVPALGTSATGPPTPTASCPAPTLSQPFLNLGDSHYYTLAPGGAFANPSGGGWTLSGGAKIVQTTQPDGTTGYALDLPSKATAVSPVMCVTSAYPTARLWVRNVVGAEGVFLNVSYANGGTWTTPQNTGQFHGQHNAWTLSNRLNIHPDQVAGWQQVRFTFIAGGTTSDFQIKNFWVDPRWS